MASLPSVYLDHILFEGTVTGEKYVDRLNIHAVLGLGKCCHNFDDLYFQEDGALPRRAISALE
jgi:hypothetical protein